MHPPVETIEKIPVTDFFNDLVSLACAPPPPLARITIYKAPTALTRSSAPPGNAVTIDAV